MLTACSGDENFAVQHPDGYDQVQFGVSGNEAFSRTIDLNAIPQSMSVWGTYDHKVKEGFFENTSVTRSGSTWSYTSPVYWADLPSYTNSDYFACMPYSPEASFTIADGSATVNYPFSLTGGFVTDAAANPLICSRPNHNPTEYNIIQFDFGQTLCGYRLLFMLGDKMGAIRSFVVKSVEMTGNVTTSCTLSRTYTLNQDNTWTAGEVSCKTPVTSSVTTAVAYSNNHSGTGSSPYNDTSRTLRVTSDGYQQWGSTLYVAPNQPFTPTFRVTYDVVVKKEDGTDVITRENATSTITFSNANFPQYTNNTSAPAGKIRDINIQIVPAYLYVLADADQTAGYILIK